MRQELEKYFDLLWPLCRSITGNGLRESFAILQEIIPLELVEVPTGTKVFDWEIPLEWNIYDAYVITPDGRKICDFKVNNLHVVNYSEPFSGELSYEELAKRLYYLSDYPEAIPYVTSYYKRSWGFCISYHDFRTLPKDGIYKVVIDSTLQPGSLTYGHLVLKGNSEKEILFSTYLCHPSMANNELSGPLAAAFLYRKLQELPERNFTYRFVFAPETIGIIAYLAEYGEYLKENLQAGYVLTCCGDKGDFTYKRSRRSPSIADKAAEHILKHSGKEYEIIDFSIGGSDERQYCSPGFNLPVGSLMRTPYQKYKQYHTSLDNKDFISFESLESTIEKYLDIVKTFELNRCYINLFPFCEPQLGKRGLYPQTGGTWGIEIEDTRKMLHLLAFADGEHDLIDIAEKRNEPAVSFEKTIGILKKKGLIK